MDVKLWNFNGHCHHRLNICRDRAVEILQILVLVRHTHKHTYIRTHYGQKAKCLLLDGAIKSIGFGIPLCEFFV